MIFNNIADQVGNGEVKNVRQMLMTTNPGALIIEDINGKDLGTVPIVICGPAGMSCPTGTH